MSTPDHDVLIVGFGPTGATLAGLLARRGLRVLAVDRDTDIHPLPRAVHFDQEIMRVVQELGLADELSADLVVNPGMDFLTADRQVLLSMRAEGDTPSGWPASLFFHQPDLEHRLRERAQALGAQVRLGVAVDSVVDAGDLTVVTFADGSERTAAFVVGCDGARSGVRKQLGVEMHDLQFEEPWLVVDLLLRDGAPPPAELALQVCDPARPTTLVPMPPPRFRFEFMLVEGDDAAAIAEPNSVRALLAPWMDPDDAVVERSAIYTFHGLIAREWRRGRVLLAGDAAHQTPPFLGQGMCAGIRDAANLAWKLARVLAGDSPVELLDTYQAEREPHVRQVVSAAVGFGRLICTTDRAVAAARDADMLAARAAGGGRVSSATMPALESAALVLDGGGAQVQQVVVDGQRLDDLVGQRFAIITRTQCATDTAAAAWWTARGALVLDAEQHAALLGVLGAADVVVVRPDRYVLTAGEALTLPQEPAASLLG